MKILFPLGAFYPSQIGGPCNTLYWHTCELNKNNIETSVVTTTIGIKEGLVNKNILYREVCGEVYYGDGNYNNLITIKVALGNIKKSNIIHLNSLFNTLSIIVFFYTKIFFRHKKIIWSVRGELNRNALIFSIWKKKPLLFIYTKFCSNVVFHATSDQETIDIKKYFNKSKIIQIPNLIKPSKRYLGKQDEKKFLYVGRIHPIKALHKIIMGFALSKHFLDSNFKFCIVGDYEERHKPYFESLKILINENSLQDKIEFKGHLSGKEKELVYADSYFTLLLSETENFGNVVVESLNQGTPVIASLGTPWEILKTKECGYHISNESDKIASVIDEVLNINEERYLKMRANSIKLIEDEFNVKNQIIRWITKYNTIYAEK
jgi:glycosyltransferase involved in cell wall biosynthesis